MSEIFRENLIWDIVENDKPDDIEITADEYYYVGWEYESGMGVENADRNLAVKCYERSIAMGGKKALLALANLYEREGDLDQAYQLTLEAAIEGKNGDALVKMGQIYFDGEYLDRDPVKACHFFELAYEQKAYHSQYYLGRLAEEGVGDKTGMENAIKYYKEGSDDFDDYCWERLDDMGIEYYGL